MNVVQVRRNTNDSTRLRRGSNFFYFLKPTWSSSLPVGGGRQRAVSPRWGSAGPSCGRRGGRYWGRVRGRGRGWARAGRRGWVWHDETTLLVPLHVPHTPERLDLRVRSFPVVPMLEVPLLKDELAPPVAWIQVSNPSRGEHTGRDNAALCYHLYLTPASPPGRTGSFRNANTDPEQLLIDSWKFGKVLETSAVRGKLSRFDPNEI